MKNYVYIETYGCAANQNNSEIIAGLLKQNGYEITNNINLAEIIIINSCVVKGKTKTKIFRRIQDLARTHKNELLIIAGCMPEIYSDQIKKLNPKSIFLGIHHIKAIAKLINDFHNNQLDAKKQNEFLNHQNEEKIALPKIPKNKLISITQISEGCIGKCTYCLTRIAKGQLFSYPLDKILSSVQSDLQQGAKEIWITSQDCASYGLDKNKYLLPELLKKILALKHKFKLRLGMMNPNNLVQIQDEILNLYHSKKMYKFLHIPIQSASDKILKDMNRQYEIKQAEEIISKFRKEFPEITISTDVIIGYPEETEKDFQENINFVKEFKPDIFNLSKFSPHKRTEIYEQMKKNKIKEFSKSIINKRTAKIMQLHRQTAMENKKIFLGKVIQVLINKKTNIQNVYESRDDNYNIVLIKSHDKSILGKNINVKIKQLGVHHMIGEVSGLIE